MDAFLEILKYTLPSVVVFITAYYMLDRLLASETKKKEQEIALENRKMITPLRLQAYERIILFLERISPNQLIVRVQKQKLTVRELQMLMLQSIRSEYEHNMTQQLYISNEGWEVVKSTKENLIRLINTAADQFGPDENGMELSKNILEMFSNVDKSPIQTAIEFLKQDLNVYTSR